MQVLSLDGITQTSQARSGVSKAIVIWICVLSSIKRTTVSYDDVGDNDDDGDVMKVTVIQWMASDWLVGPAN